MKNTQKPVEAVKSEKTIAAITKRLKEYGSQTYADVWSLCINLALRISDLLAITYNDVVGQEMLIITERKTKKIRQIKLNDTAKGVIARRRAENLDDIFLFQATGSRVQKLEPKALDRSTVARKFAEIGNMKSISVKLGTHSMRKTRGYHLLQAGHSIETICKMFQHSSPAVTLRYIGIEQEDIDATFDDLCL